MKTTRLHIRVNHKRRPQAILVQLGVRSKVLHRSNAQTRTPYLRRSYLTWSEQCSWQFYIVWYMIETEKEKVVWPCIRQLRGWWLYWIIPRTSFKFGSILFCPLMLNMDGFLYFTGGFRYRCKACLLQSKWFAGCSWVKIQDKIAITLVLF